MSKKKQSAEMAPANFEGALSELQKMSETPRETELERFVRLHLDVIQKALSQGYTYADICALLKSNNISGTSTTTLGKALKKYGVEASSTSLISEESKPTQVSQWL